MKGSVERRVKRVDPRASGTEGRDANVDVHSEFLLSVICICAYNVVM